MLNHYLNMVYVQQLKSMASEQNELLAALFELLNELQELENIDPSVKEKIRDKLRKKLKKRLSRKAFRKLEALLNMYFIPQSTDTIKQAIQKIITAVKNNLDKLNKNPDKSKQPTADLYINLFGVLSSYITGSHAVPMSLEPQIN